MSLMARMGIGYRRIHLVGLMEIHEADSLESMSKIQKSASVINPSFIAVLTASPRLVAFSLRNRL
jgi:hypothetical protein